MQVIRRLKRLADGWKRPIASDAVQIEDDRAFLGNSMMLVQVRHAAGVAAAAALLLALPAQAEEEPIKIGAVLALTGPAGVYGAPAAQGLRVALDDLPGKLVAGRPYKLTIYDSEGNSTKAVQLFRRLVDSNGVDVIVGPSTSGESLSVVPVANQLKVSMLSGGGSEKITNPVTPYAFALAPTDRLMVEFLLGVLKKRGLNRVALIFSMDGFGQSGGTIVQELAAAAGIELVATETFSPQDTSMTPQLIRIREKNPDAVIAWAPNPGPSILLKNAAEIGYKVPVFLSTANALASFTKQTGPAAEGVYASALPIINPASLPDSDPRKAPSVKFADAYQARYGVPPDQTSGLTLDAVLIIEAAAKAITGPITPDKLRAAIETVRICGADGCRVGTPSDHRGLTKDSLVLMQVQNGQWTTVQP
ncbi:ABC transporter substrate-binding protein [Chelatococcus reniformis]|uniref:Branched-chain amino acid ABC transporter substrate-binding protein n=1 Tax=Chelatococcus reniformis TaxID=1494448 RepID=A0A916UM04_9HYPH|nr:ABC transporter substrate-binding protein [Chelatococcus reniformis]GGC77902.1 branched-chain amino acid ABC transporter substrate-binding protein [Chelatococcus reniformis]